MVDLVTMTAVLYQAGADGLGKMRASARYDDIMEGAESMGAVIRG